MGRTLGTGAWALVAVLAAGIPAGAQEEPADRPVYRVEQIRVDSEAIELTVGETFDVARLSIVPVDADGEVVEGVDVVRSLEGGVARLDGSVIEALAPGEARLMLFVLKPPREGNQVPPVVSSVPVVVSELPVAELEIARPEHGLYAGTIVPLEIRAYDTRGEEREAEVTWSSRNPEVARVDSRGRVHLLQGGRTVVTASVDGVEGTRTLEVVENPVRTLELEPSGERVRTGDVVHFRAIPRDAGGRPVEDLRVTYSVGGAEVRAPLGASVYPDGAFVAEDPGAYRLVASAGPVASEAVVEAVAREAEMNVVQVGTGIISDHPTSDLWAFKGLDGRDYVYTGTHSGGQKMYAWDVTDPASPVLTDSVVVDARVVNDVKVNEDASLAVITREGASDRRNGIVVLDLGDPAHPTVLSEYAETVTGGVHNTFIVGDLVYAVHNGTRDIHIISIEDPESPTEVGRWGLDRPGKLLHDVWVVDGLLYASYWDDGVWILDAGDGRWGGTPTEPVAVSHYAYADLPGEWGNTHVAFPYRNSDGRHYLFVGDEVFGCETCVGGPRGYIHILDMSDPENLEEVARYRVPEAGTHNIWLQDDKLYVAYYQAGLRVVDVSGDLRGDLYRQGREIAWLPTGHPEGRTPNSPMAWGPQPFWGNIFVSDLNSGLWVVRLEPKEREVLP